MKSYLFELFIFLFIFFEFFELQFKLSMLNATIFALTAGSFVHSPLIAANQYNFRSYSCTFSYLFSSAIFSTYNKLNSFTAERSTFKNIIGTAIILESKSYSNQVFKETLNENSQKLVVQSCLFTNCVSQGNGGGILIFIPESSTQISNTGFTNCKTSNNGGAFYIISKEFSIDRSCITLCSGDKYDAFYYSNAKYNHDDEFKLTYVYNISPSVESESVICFDSVEPVIQNDNITGISRTSIRSILEIPDIESIVIQYNSFVSCSGQSILYFKNFKGEIRNCNFDYNRAANNLIHFGSTGSGLKICFCCFMRDDSKAYVDTYSLFSDCVFDHPYDEDKFPNKDLRVRCTFDSKYTTNDIDNQDMTKIGCWALISNAPTEMTPLITTEPESDSSLSSTLYGVMVVAAVVVICILAFFVYRWWSNRHSKDYLLTMYAQV